MAPNKKKKKAAANPARGFATTSSVSKSKVADIDVFDEEITTPVIAAANQKQDVHQNQDDPAHKEKELSELTPERLEAQLEDSELQLFVEKYGPKSKKESTRHVSRLETERRLFRGQTEYLRISSWIPEEIAELILGHLESQKLNDGSPSVGTNPAKEIVPPPDDLVAKVWTLRRALEGLGFLKQPVQEAIGWLLASLQPIEQDSAFSSKDSLWGLEQCLDYLAISCNIDDLPGYDSHQVPSRVRQLQGTKAFSDGSSKKGNNTASPSIISKSQGYDGKAESR